MKISIKGLETIRRLLGESTLPVKEIFESIDYFKRDAFETYQINPALLRNFDNAQIYILRYIGLERTYALPNFSAKHYYTFLLVDEEGYISDIWSENEERWVKLDELEKESLLDVNL